MKEMKITIINNKNNYFSLIILTIVLLTSPILGQPEDQKNKTLLPSGTEEVVEFGAYSTQLKYTDQWDNRWPVSEIADVVVRFGEKEPRFVFWRGTSYIPCWASFDGPWFTNEFFERRGGAESGTVSMVEPMSDKQCRYSSVRIIENTEARVVIHWRYAPTDLEYSMAYMDDETHWGDWADEYYILYPDAAGIRKATLFTSALDDWIEYHESIVINQPGTVPEDNINFDAVTLINLKGESKTYVWTEDGGPDIEEVPENFSIQKINLKSEYKPFTIVDSKNVGVQSYGGHAPGSHFNFWDHWPVSQTKSDTRAARSSERPSHTSLSHLMWEPYSETEKSRTWIMMHGMTNSGDEDLVNLAASWINPPELKLISSKYKNEGYDKSQRAYVLSAEENNKELNFILSAEKNSPLVNPAFVIKGWGKNKVKLKIDDKEIEKGANFKVGFVSSEKGINLILWLKLESSKPVKMSLYR